MKRKEKKKEREKTHQQLLELGAEPSRMILKSYQETYREDKNAHHQNCSDGFMGMTK